MALRLSPIVRQVFPLALLLCVALIVRLGYLPLYGNGDLNDSTRWGGSIYNQGLLSFYANNATAQTRTYPPISTLVFGIQAELYGLLRPTDRHWTGFSDPLYLAIVKSLPVMAELAGIALAYLWLRRERLYRWLIPGLLAVFPGIAITSAFWGQNDSVFMLFVLLTLIALNRDHPRWAWLCLGLAILSKQQSAVLLPLVGILTFRRNGIRELMTGIAILGAIMTLITTPFVLVSGIGPTFSPYLQATGNYHSVTVNALNFWFLFDHPTDGFVFSDKVLSNQTAFGPFRLGDFGSAVLALYTLLILWQVWVSFSARREFVWAAALYFGIFMLPTEIHERYLYPGTVLLIWALAQDRRLWVAALGTMYTYSYNVAQVVEPFTWLHIPSAILWSNRVTLQVAVLNGLWFVDILVVTGFSEFSNQRFVRVVMRSLEAVALLALAVPLIVNDLSDLKVTRLLVQNVPSAAVISSDISNTNITSILAHQGNATTWFWDMSAPLNPLKPSAWLKNEAHYLLLTSAGSNTDSYNAYLQRLTEDRATLIAESPTALGLTPQYALLFISGQIYPVGATFANSLKLETLHPLRHEDGTFTIFFQWHVEQTPAVDYHIFVHLVNSDTDIVSDLADDWIGKGVYPTTHWQKHLTVLDAIDLPAESLKQTHPPYQFQIGLYDLATGNRAPAERDGNPLVNDQVLFSLPSDVPQVP